MILYKRPIAEVSYFVCIHLSVAAAVLVKITVYINPTSLDWEEVISSFNICQNCVSLLTHSEKHYIVLGLSRDIWPNSTREIGQHFVSLVFVLKPF